MRILCKGLLALLLVLSLAWPAAAQSGSPPDRPAADPAASPRTLTGKERLGRKWMDEQRIDNCNVPIGKRGSKPRPSICPHVPIS